MTEEVPVSETPCVLAKNKNENVQCMYIQHARSVPDTATHCGHVPYIKGAQNGVEKIFETETQEVISEFKNTSRIS